MVPAARGVNNLGINRRTIQVHYRRMREHIAQASEQALGLLAGEIAVDESYFGGVRKGKRGRGAAGKIPVFGLLKRDGVVRVVFPRRVDTESRRTSSLSVYWSSSSPMSIDSVLCRYRKCWCRSA